MNYAPYPTRATMPSRKARKQARNKVFQGNYTIKRRKVGR